MMTTASGMIRSRSRVGGSRSPSLPPPSLGPKRTTLARMSSRVRSRQQSFLETKGCAGVHDSRHRIDWHIVDRDRLEQEVSDPYEADREIDESLEVDVKGQGDFRMLIGQAFCNMADLTLSAETDHYRNVVKDLAVQLVNCICEARNIEEVFPDYPTDRMLDEDTLAVIRRAARICVEQGILDPE